MTESNQNPDPADAPRPDTPGSGASPEVETEDTKRARRVAQRENFFVSLIVNVIAPTLIMTQLNDPDRLGPRWALVVGLAFPIGYSVWYFLKSRSFSWIAFFGLLAVLLTGGLELLGVAPIWFAVKEAAIPLLIGVATLLSLKTRNPLVNTLLLNPQIIDRERIDKRLAELGNEDKFHVMLVRGTWWVAASFLVSAILNFVLAYVIIRSDAGTPERTEELGLMQGWSWIVITIPVTAMLMFALWQILSGLQKLTGLELDDLFHPEARGEKSLDPEKSEKESGSA